MLKRILFFFLAVALPCFTLAQALPTVTSSPDLQYLKKKLREKKFSVGFTNAILRNYDAESFSTVLKYNMLGFLNPPQHSVLVTEEGQIKSQEFLEKNKKTFITVSRRDHVDPAVIAALLWVETKHGKLTGRYHVTSVFAHLIQVTRKDVVEELTKLALEADKEKPKAEQHKDLKKRMRTRTARKAAWALDELKAMEKLYRKDKKMVTELQGSFAGAFGIPQFIPSSYFTYARPLVPGRVADLYTPEDAISSVSHYLKKTGWNQKKRARKMKALMHYNQSEDYAESILELSENIKSGAR